MFNIPFCSDMGWRRLREWETLSSSTRGWSMISINYHNNPSCAHLGVSMWLKSGQWKLKENMPVASRESFLCLRLSWGDVMQPSGDLWRGCLRAQPSMSCCNHLPLDSLLCEMICVWIVSFLVGFLLLAAKSNLTNIGGHWEWEASATIPSIMDEKTKFQRNESNFLQCYMPGKEQRVRREWIQDFISFHGTFSKSTILLKKYLLGLSDTLVDPVIFSGFRAWAELPEGRAGECAQRQPLLCANA